MAGSAKFRAMIKRAKKMYKRGKCKKWTTCVRRAARK